MNESFFTGVRIEESVLSSGARIGLPVRYYDWSCINALFPASASEVRRLLPTDKLSPILISPRLAMVSFTGMEYRKIAGVVPYNEFAIGVPVQYEPRINIPGLPLLFDPLFSPKWFKKFGIYIHRLPVTTQAAYDFGVEIWGYPKSVNEIIFEEGQELSRCELRTQGRNILTLEVKRLPSRFRPLSWHTYTVKDHQLVRTPVQTQGEYGVSRSRGGASWILGSGLIADEVARLAIGKRPLECIYASHVQSMLHAASERLPM